MVSTHGRALMQEGGRGRRAGLTCSQGMPTPTADQLTWLEPVMASNEGTLNPSPGVPFGSCPALKLPKQIMINMIIVTISIILIAIIMIKIINHVHMAKV